MLPDLIKENITSISEPELEELYQKFIAANPNSDNSHFVHELFNSRQINTQEYKDFQTQEKIEFTSVVNFEEIDKLSSAIDKLKALPEGEAYTILEPIDQGAMGEIMLARDNKLGRTVAYKKIHQTVAEYPTFLSRFIMEAQITAQLEHPSIVPVYALMLRGNEIGYTMKLINGITMKDLVRETCDQYDKRGEPDEYHTLHARLDHFLKVCDAIHYAHRKGVVHRDLKPINIMIGPYNEVYVMDWGIAKLVKVDENTFDDKTRRINSDSDVDKDFDKTAVGQVMGTPAYMSPEQAEGQHDTLDHRSDLYSLGLILFEIVTFHKAINGDTVEQIHMKAIQGIIDPPPPYAKQADEQEQLMAIIKKATQYLPEDRYQTVQEFADDIRRFMHGDPIHALPETTRRKIVRWVSHHSKATMNIMIYSLLLALFMLSIFLYLYIDTLKGQGGG